MRNSIEISAELDAKVREFDACQDAAQRKTLAGEVENLTNEFNEASVSESARKALANQRVLSPKEKEEVRSFSISKFLREAQHDNLTGIEAEMAKEGEAEFKRSGINPAANSVYIPSFALRSYDDTNATESGYGNAFKEESMLSYDGKLRGQLLAEKLGVRFINNLVGNLNIVTGGADASWVAEDANATKEKPAYAKVTLSPKRLQVLQGITYDLMHQNSKSVDALIMDDMVKAHAAALDAAILAGAGANGEPSGVLGQAGNTVSIDTNGGAITYAKLVEMETAVGEDNGLLDNSLAYVSNAKVMGQMKTIPQIAGYPFYLLNDGKVNGYPFYMSNALPSNLKKGSSQSGVLSAAVFGAWSQVICGTWGGGLQFIIDPYTAKKAGVLEVTAIAYHDVAVRHANAFAKIVDITTA
jgi:hypothetical protein